MRYNPALDGVRAVAVLLVILAHSQVPGMDNGRGGVDIFFVLSGYLITSLLAREEATGGIRLGAFYLRRARRLYPALLVMVLLVGIGGAVIGHPLRWQDVEIVLLYFSDYGAAWWSTPTEPIKHTWSLSVEEHFYVLWPLTVMLITKLSRERRLILLAAGYVLATWWRFHVGAAAEWEAYFRFDTRLSGLLLGAMLAFLPTTRRAWMAVLPLAFVMLVSLADAPLYVANVPAEWLGAALVVWAASGHAKPLTLPPLVYLGRISYGVYLFHWPIAMLFRDRAPWPVTLAVTLTGAVALATASYYLIERRIRQPSEPRRSLERGVADPVA